jgi:ribosomal protein S18 acetylase RimI-like enzyme
MERLDDILIIAAGPGDAAGLADVHVRAWRETYAGLLPGAYLAQLSRPLHERRWKRLLTAAPPPEIVLAAEGRGGLVGYCAAQGRLDTDSAEVSTLYVIKAAQKLGLGRRLLAAAARAQQARGASAMHLWVLNGNDAARGFYEHLGGVAGTERPVRGWGGGFRETAYHWPDITALTRMA